MSNEMTVDEAAEGLLLKVEEGTTCPCCGQHVQAYKRRIRASQARFLMDLVRLSTPQEPWVHYKDCFVGGRDYNYLVHFGLAQSRPREGLWRPTETGVDFVVDRLAIPKWILVYNNNVIRISAQIVTIRECLSSGDFDYDALMQGDPA
jgi:hypothetical protein